MKLKEILNWMNNVAPFDSAEEWDNVGLLAGNEDMDVERVLICLDVTGEAIDAAERMGAQLIISHHPLLFDPIRRLTDTLEAKLACRCIENHMAIIAAHTNLDKAQEGVNVCLLRALGLHSTQQEGVVFCAELSQPLRAGELLEKMRGILNPHTWFYGREDAMVSKLAVCSGGGGSYFEGALQLGADAFLTGEMAHHHVLRAKAQGLQLYVAGHAETENIVLQPLADRLCRETGLHAEIYQ